MSAKLEALGPTRQRYWAGALGLACMAYAGYASLATFFGPAEEEPLLAGVTIDKLPQALTALPPTEASALIARQRTRLSAEPLDRTAALNLAMLYSATGEQRRADDLLAATANLSLRDGRAQLMALPVMARAGDIASALRSGDALLRTYPALSNDIFPILLPLVSDERAVPRITEALALSPPWRSQFLEWLSHRANQPQLAYQLLSALKKTDAGPSRPEMQALIRHYLQMEDFQTAYFIWLDSLSEPELRKVRNVFDGDFDLPLVPQDSLYFDWYPIDSGTIRISSEPKFSSGTENVLVIDFYNNFKPANPLYQYLRIAPGRYNLTGLFKADNLQTVSGLVWRIWCVEGSHELIATSPALVGTLDWTSFEASLEVPENCSTQVLKLEMKSPAILDQRISGRAFYDNLKLTSLVPN
jgi:hypothetical protein